MPDGARLQGRHLRAFPGGLGGPDGLAIAEGDTLAVADAGLGTVWLFDRLGEPIGRIRSSAGQMALQHRLWRT